MSNALPVSGDPKNAPLSAAARSTTWNRHAILAILLVAATAVGGFKMYWKYPVPWPEGCRISDDFRLTSLPQAFSPPDDRGPGKTTRYQMVTADGVLFHDPETHKPIRDGKPDGEIIWDEDDRKVLDVGTYLDAQLYSKRSSNWYVGRIYEDLKAPLRSTLRLWQLDLTYYTGKMENVAHVPGRCMIAGGAEPAGPEVELEWKVPVSNSDWRTVRVMRARFTDGETPGEFVQYYTFCLNGLNEPSWLRVHSVAKMPIHDHCYFAKIQFAPRYPVTDLAACDRAAQSFFNAFLPEVLQALPTKADVEKLNAGPKH